MRPADALAYKRLLIVWMRDVLGQDAPDPERYSETTVGLISAMQGEIAPNLLSFLPHCETYYVTADMTAVAKAAGRELPVESVDLTAWPSSEGFMVFDQPIADVQLQDGSYPIEAVAWMSTRMPGDVGPGFSSATELFTLIPNPGARSTYPLVPFCSQKILMSEAGPIYDAEDGTDSLVPNLLSAWLLMQQSITEVAASPVDRPERRRCMKAGLPSHLKVVRLRRIDHSSSDGDGPSAFSHRWLVAGHWRQQWYPSDRTNRPIWINPYVKGPDDRPLVVKERVTAWVR